MPEIETQLRDYFDVTVERITAEDILAGQRVFETIRPVTPRRAWHPAWVAVGAFVATVAVLGGTFGLGAVLTGPTGDVGSGGMPDVVHRATSTVSDWWPLFAATALVIAVAGALIALNRRQRTHEEKKEAETMATTIDAQPAKTTDTTDYGNRGLIVAVVVLAVALLALGAWAVYQQTATSETAAPAAVEELLADYYAALNNYDGEAILALTTENFVHDNGFTTYDQAGMATLFSVELPDWGYRVERVGEPIVAGDGPYYVAEVDHLTDASGAAEDGISTFVVIDTSDGLKIRSQFWRGSGI